MFTRALWYSTGAGALQCSALPCPCASISFLLYRAIIVNTINNSDSALCSYGLQWLRVYGGLLYRIAPSGTVLCVCAYYVILLYVILHYTALALPPRAGSGAKYPKIQNATVPKTFRVSLPRKIQLMEGEMEMDLQKDKRVLRITGHLLYNIIS